MAIGGGTVISGGVIAGGGASLSVANTWTAAQTFNANQLKLGGAGAGVATFTYANSASSVTITFPAVAGTVLHSGTASVTSTPSDQAGTTSTSFVMVGLAGAITPNTSTRMLLIISGDSSTSNLGTGNIRLKYGTGTAPTNGQAQAGTTIGADLQVNTAAGVNDAFTMQAIATGLTVGQALWLDLAYGIQAGAGTQTITKVTITAIEI